jgi:hypothetical protein
MPFRYCDFYEINTPSDKLDVFAQVHLTPVVGTDFSVGRGGFIFAAKAVYGEVQLTINNTRRVTTDIIVN